MAGVEAAQKELVSLPLAPVLDEGKSRGGAEEVLCVPSGEEEDLLLAEPVDGGALRWLRFAHDLRGIAMGLGGHGRRREKGGDEGSEAADRLSARGARGHRGSGG